ncbi:MAG TPA: type IV pilus assembly protein PilM [Candidatus Paceibacterota bacterium]|nr:type IV pilus assembly protein PilM [Candidatus Paceibacterota bacterium]
MAANVVGLDIGSTAVRGVELRAAKKNKPNLLRFHEVALPPGAVSRGEILDAVAVGSALKQLWSEGRFKTKDVVLGTGNQNVLVRDLTVPKMSLREIRESLPVQVQSLLQMTLEDSILDFYPVSEGMNEQGPTVNGLLIAAEKEGILSTIRVAERAGLTPVDVDLIPFALNRLLIGKSGVEATVAIIDVGGSTTSMIIVREGVPQFVRIIPAGGDDLTQALKAGLEINANATEELKRTLHVGAALAADDDSETGKSQCSCPKCLADIVTVEDPRANEILQRVTGELLSGLRNTVSYFNNTHFQNPVTQILLTGGGSRLSGFATALRAMTQIPVSPANPLSMVNLSRKSSNKNQIGNTQSLSVALGLAMRNLS